jgi:hypothetical protein
VPAQCGMLISLARAAPKSVARIILSRPGAKPKP